jgi:phenylalanyl-tRNA synthetase alpha chain
MELPGMHNLQTIVAAAKSAIDQAQDVKALEQVRVTYLGKSGSLTELLKQLGQIPAEQRPQFGQAVNQAKQQLQALIEIQAERLQAEQLSLKLASERIDVSLPGRGQTGGGLHPITLIRHKIEQFFNGLGFTTVTGPEIENDYYNFTALNIPAHHPARAMHDTFYFPSGLLLRTHTSPVQIRAMEKQRPPIRIITAGRTYRCDSDVRHTPMFHQVELLWVDENLTLANLKWLMRAFLSHVFETEVEIKFRASYFPFTEPSAEVDMTCVQCLGNGCRVCSHSGWIEIGGCGLVHPNVLAAVNIDSEKYTGLAFGMGIERIAMLRYGIDDLRVLFENDIRLLEQF